MLQPPHIPSTQLKHPLLDQLKVELEVLRLDQVHPTVSGNKFFKLKDSFIATPKDINGLSVKEWLTRKEANNFTI